MSSIMRLVEQLHAWGSLQGEFGMPVEQIPHRKLNKVLTFYEPGAGLPPPRVSKEPNEQERASPDTGPEYWSVRCNSLTEFGGLRCRNVDAKFQAFTVATRVALGLSNRPASGPTKIEPEVRVRLQLGEEESAPSPLYSLSLDAAHHFQTWTIHATRLLPGDSDLWKTYGRVDYAVMHVFVFDIQEDGTVTPLQSTDYEEEADIKLLLDTCRRFSPASKKLIIDDDEETVASKFFRDDLFRTGGNTATVEVGRETGVRTVPTRIAVGITLTCYKQTGDFQPAGPFPRAAGAARFWPVVQVASTRKVMEVHASVEVDRPSTSEWDAAHGCHGSRDISSMLVVDTNDGARIGAPVQAMAVPHWSSLFNYFLTDAEKELGGEELHMVRTRKPRKDEPNSDVVRKSPSPPGYELGSSRRVMKLPGQGEFDNIHIAPKMSVVGAKFARVTEILLGGLMTKPVIVDLSDRARFKLDDLNMAPFCAHDCFHMHWRWTDAGPDHAQLGFVGYQPNVKAGATMVPEPQDVYLWFRARGCFTYHAVHHDEAGAPSGRWIPICHHGAAYLTDSNTAAIAGAHGAVGLLSRVRFLRSTDEFDLVNDESWAIFYWNIRYYIDKDASGKYLAIDRTSPTTAAALRTTRRM